MSAKDDERLKRESGLKLANFRSKLALAMGKQKITQGQFGRAAGGYSLREISSYETGIVEIPGLLLYRIWKAGYSVDGLFSESEIAVPGGDDMKDDNKSKLSLTDIKTSDIDSDLREEQQLLDLIGKMRRDRPTETARKIFEEKVALEIKKDYETEARVIGVLNKPVESRGEGPSGKGVASHSKAGGSKRHRRR